MRWKPNVANPTAITLAIAATTERFTQLDIARRAGCAKGTVSATLKEMECLGMIKVCRTGQRGIKIWCKTEKYCAPDAEKTKKAAASKDNMAYGDDRETRVHLCLLDLATAMSNWRSRGACV